MNWVIVRYKSGANPYIIKTEKELKRILNKYGEKIHKLNDTLYFVNDCEVSLWS